jgi:hypothetical protein
VTAPRTASRSRTAAVRPRRNTRLDWRILRWQARLDAGWADRVLPWLLAGGLFVVFASVALARMQRLDGGQDLARAVQAAWQLADASSPLTTVGTDINYFAFGTPLAFIPLAVVTRFLPVAVTLLLAQAASLALGLVPVWHIGRKVANLRVGAAAALVLVYALHPAIADLDLGDFHPTTMALTPLLLAAYTMERRRWLQFAAFAALAMAWNAELGIVVAGLGVVLFMEGERRVGTLALVAGLGWTVGALLLVQGPLGGGLVGEQAFADYGDSALGVLIEVLRNPFRPLGDLLAEENVRVVVWILAPLLFVPLLAFRKLAPALPLQALYFIGDVPVTGPSGGGRTVPLVAFAFVAAPFGLARLGRRSIERVNVDRRFLLLLASAAVAALLASSTIGPYGDAWASDREGEAELRVALAAVPDRARVRAPEALVSSLGERHRIEVLQPGDSDPESLLDGVDALVLDESTLVDLDEHDRFLLRRRIEDLGFVLVERAGPVDVFVER